MVSHKPARQHSWPSSRAPQAKELTHVVPYRVKLRARGSTFEHDATDLDVTARARACQVSPLQGSIAGVEAGSVAIADPIAKNNHLGLGDTAVVTDGKKT
jgi:hypothetical protein